MSAVSKDLQSGPDVLLKNMKKSYLALIGTAAALWLSACSSTDQGAASSTPVAGNGSNDFFDASVQEMYSQLPAYYRTKYFALGIPEQWRVLSFSDNEGDAHISVERNDHSSLVTIRVTPASHKTVDETCEYARKGFDANGLQYVSEPEIAYGTCIIEGKENTKDVTLWLRQYDDDNSVYSINFTGSLETVGEILSYLVGNEKLMQLMVRPL